MVNVILQNNYSIFLYIRFMFSLHDTVICHNARRLPNDRLRCPLIKGTEYQIIGLKACACGAIFIDVGLSLDPARFEISCGCRRIIRGGTWWFDARRFKEEIVIRKYFELVKSKAFALN